MIGQLAASLKQGVAQPAIRPHRHSWLFAPFESGRVFLNRGCYGTIQELGSEAVITLPGSSHCLAGRLVMVRTRWM
jgi:hypothetical protein